MEQIREIGPCVNRAVLRGHERIAVSRHLRSGEEVRPVPARLGVVVASALGGPLGDHEEM